MNEYTHIPHSDPNTCHKNKVLRILLAEVWGAPLPLDESATPRPIIDGEGHRLKRCAKGSNYRSSALRLSWHRDFTPSD